jgi:hypothetical protein
VERRFNPEELIMKTLNPQSYGDHSIFNPLTFFIATPMITQLRQRVCQWLWCGSTGGLILGEPRIGKSRALKILARGLETRAGEPIPVHYFSVPDRDVKTITSVFRNLFLSTGDKLKRGIVTDELVDNLVVFFAESALVNRLRLVVLLVDEMQRLAPKQIAAFAELHDRLEDLIGAETNLVVVFVGNDNESDALLKTLQLKQYDHIHGRFFTQDYRFFGVRTKDDLQQCLREYDTATADEQCSCTAFFLPEPYLAGWRLESLSAALWALYRAEYGQPLKLTSWPMQYFTATVKILLVDYLARYGVDNPTEIESMIHHSLAVSGLPAGRVTSNA